MSTEKELMNLVADYGKECISAGISDMIEDDEVRQRITEDVRKSHDALTARLRALLAELEAAREDAARYRWLRDSSDKALWDGLMQTFPFAHLEFDRQIDAARKGEA